jgi:hypothetical protein
MSCFWMKCFNWIVELKLIFLSILMSLTCGCFAHDELLLTWALISLIKGYKPKKPRDPLLRHNSEDDEMRFSGLRTKADLPSKAFHRLNKMVCSDNLNTGSNQTTNRGSDENNGKNSTDDFKVYITYKRISNIVISNYSLLYLTIIYLSLDSLSKSCSLKGKCCKPLWQCSAFFFCDAWYLNFFPLCCFFVNLSLLHTADPI